MKTPIITTHTPAVKYITICGKSRSWRNGQRKRPKPVLSLGSNCLQSAGFTIGQVLDVVCECGKLTITIAREQTYSAIQKRVKEEHVPLA